MQFHDFLGEVQNKAKLSSLDEALKATRATLTTLAERLEGEQPSAVAAQLPDEIGIFLTGENSGKGERFDSDEFSRRVSEKEGVGLNAGIWHARAVLDVLSQAVSAGELDDVKAQLPDDYLRFFSGAEGSMTKH